VSDFLLGVVAALGLVALIGVVAYVVLRRAFERASHHAADQMGRVLGELSDRAAATPLGRRTGAAARAAACGFTNLGAYASAQGISEDAARREFAETIERVARIMDNAVKIPIIGRVGLDAVLGLFPVAGDAASAAVSVMLIARSIKYGIPREIIARMLANVLIDLLMGAIPLLGDLADIWFRANSRNVALLREYLGDEARNTIEVTATRVS
jgi:Domain of unknown function (DUF4112)